MSLLDDIVSNTYGVVWARRPLVKKEDEKQAVIEYLAKTIVKLQKSISEGKINIKASLKIFGDLSKCNP